MDEPPDMQTQKVSHFASITGTDVQTARVVLERHSWNLEAAVVQYYDNDEELSPMDSPVSDTVHDTEPIPSDSGDSSAFPPPTIQDPTSRNLPEVVSSVFTRSSDAAPAMRSTSAHRRSERSATRGPAAGSGPKINTLATLHQQQESSSDSSDEEDGQAFYAGGSEHSGLQVLGPPRGTGQRGDIVTDLFRSVRAFGAEVVQPTGGSRGPRQRLTAAFTGAGVRLGDAQDEAQPAATEERPQETGTRPRRGTNAMEVNLRFYRNGFNVNDGPLRNYNDPRSQAFIEHIRNGEVPRELILESSGMEIGFNMEDIRHRNYVPPPVNRTFAGAGQKLGSVTPPLVSTPEDGPEVSQEQRAMQEDEAPQESASQKQKEAANPIVVNNDLPTTNLQIRLPDGSRTVVAFNHTHTVGDIRRYIEATSPQYRIRPYILMSTYPREEIGGDGSKTLAEAGLLNTVIHLHAL